MSKSFPVKSWSHILASAMLLMLAIAPVGFAQPYTPNKVTYLQSTAVQAIFPPLGIQFDTPGFAANKTGFTTHEEMMDFIQGLQKKSDRMQVKIIGYSQEGRPIPLLIFSRPSIDNPDDIRKMNKPVVWFQGQQHGDEPAGGESMLVLAQQLAVGSLGKQILDKVSVFIVPNCNPDGSYLFSRNSAARKNLNRDHAKLELPETIAVHRAFAQFQPDITVDAHEFGVGRGPKGLLAYQDILLQTAGDPNMPTPVQSMAETLFLANVKKALEAEKMTHGPYYTSSMHGERRSVFIGGFASATATSVFGIRPTVSILVESRGIGLGRQNFARRVAGQMVAHTAILQIAADNADYIRMTMDDVRKDIIEKGRSADPADKIIIKSKLLRSSNYSMPFVDAKTGKVTMMQVRLFDRSKSTPVIERVRPVAYILLPTCEQDIKTLATAGFRIERLSEPAHLTVEGFQLGIGKTASIVSEQEREFPAGSYLIPMAQPAGNLLALLLEADSYLNIVKPDADRTLPVYRYLGNAPVETTMLKAEQGEP